MESQKFTVRIKPFPGESLYSFIMRFARDNGISFLKFWDYVKQSGSHFVQMNDVGLLNFAPVNVIDPFKMASLINLSVEDIFKMSLYYAIKRFCGDGNVERARFFSGMLRDKLHYCPDCLHESHYHRLLWSIEGINKCIFHDTDLINKCPNCNKEMKLKDLSELGTCPYCGYSLDKGKSILEMKDAGLPNQKWLYDAFNTLISTSNADIEPSQIAIRVLFILNRQKPTFNRDVVEEAISNKWVLPTLLQHARESLSNKRTLHISFILSVLYQNNISMGEFLSIKVPGKFISSLRNKPVLKKDEVYCIAPWCKNYMKNGLLVKTGTSFKRKENGEIYKYYLICPECRCEYAFDGNNELKERTYFIKSYYMLNNFSKQDLGLKRLSQKTGLSQDMIRRCLSYFESRGMFVGECNRKSYNIDEMLLHEFIKAVKTGTNINEIKEWPVWESYYHFLFYRYHKDVAIEISMREYRMGISCEETTGGRQKFIRDTLKRMINDNVHITIKSICDEINVCPQTLRNWDCNPLIANAKSEQKEIRLNEIKNNLYKKVDEFFNKNCERIIVSEELYKYIGIKRNILWRSAPEITSYLSVTCREHNKIVRKIK